MAERESGSPDVRDRLVRAAVGLLESAGPGAVQARRLASEIGASTTAVYHYFGGMPALVHAVAEEGFRRLDAHLAAVPLTADPVADICRQALGYRQAARENPHLYDLMFGLAAPGGHRPQPQRRQDGTAAAAAYRHLADATTRAADGGRIRGDPERAAAQLWSVLHGFVTLELAGHFDGIEDTVAAVLVPTGVHLLIGLGDDPLAAWESASVVAA